MSVPFDYESASALFKGRRDYQEDALISNFPRGSDVALVVLADGMGGHAAGDVASKIVVTEVFSELMFCSGDAKAFEATVTDRLHAAALAANGCLKEHVQAFPETRGMGATLVAGALVHDKLYWISVGDSPLFLFRAGALVQLNEDHSMAPQIDFMVKSGLMSADEGRYHPDRNTLTSVLFGEEVPKIDCPQDPVTLEAGDIVIVASDGLQFLANSQIEAILRRNKNRTCDQLVEILLHEVSALDDPDLDNVSFSVIRAHARGARSASNDQSVAQSDILRVG